MTIITNLDKLGIKPYNHPMYTDPQDLRLIAGDAEGSEITAPSTPPPFPTTEPAEPQASDPVTQEDLIALLQSLEQTLTRGAGDARCILMEQADILDSLFRALVSANLKDAIIAKFYGKTNMAEIAAWLGTVLQVQKQCRQALKTASTVEYLDAMVNNLSPLPPQTGKRNE